MGRRRAAGAGINTKIRCHTFRATGITDHLTNGGRIEVAQRMAGNANAKSTGLWTAAIMISAYENSSGSVFDVPGCKIDVSGRHTDLTNANR